MIEKIQICNVATYGSTPEDLIELKEINFVYGSNGTGKTTVSRVIADCGSYADCNLTWKGGSPLELLVYNRDFVERNFNQPDELKGIFTLGEKDKDTLDKIDAAKTELDQITDKITKLKAALNGDDGDGGKHAELAILETDFESKCWDLKLKHDEKLQGAFAGVRGKKSAFKAKLLAESASNSSTAVPLAEIEKKAVTVFGEAPEAAISLNIPNGADNLAIQNTMRRILENYFEILGNINPDDICAHFEGKEKLICRSLFSWINDGSHFAHDSLYVSIDDSIDDSMVESYLNVFKRIFQETKHIPHYNMMMGESDEPESVEIVEAATPIP